MRMEVVPGTELSAHIREREVHILAYCNRLPRRPAWHDPRTVFSSPLPAGGCDHQSTQRMGLTVSLDDVLSQANGSPLGRPHIAAAMVQNGLVANRDEAFSRYIGDHGPAFKPKPYTAAKDLIALIHRTGGVAVLAHPSISLPESIIEQLVAYGLDGIEVFHPAHQPAQMDFYDQFADRYGLIKSGGSDSHGDSHGTRIGDYGSRLRSN